MRERNETAEKMLSIGALVTDIDGCVTDGTYGYGPDGDTLKFFNDRDNVGVRLAQAAGWPVVVITARTSPMVARWASELEVTRVHQGALDKRATLQAVAAELGLDLQQVAYLGDDLLDLPAMDLVGLCASPHDAALLVRQQVDLVLDLNGGRGALRELVERILDTQGKLTTTIHAYLSSRGVTEPGGRLPAACDAASAKIGFRQ